MDKQNKPNPIKAKNKTNTNIKQTTMKSKYFIYKMPVNDNLSEERHFYRFLFFYSLVSICWKVSDELNKSSTMVVFLF